MDDEKTVAAVAQAGGWGRMFRYLSIVAGVGGVLFGLGVEPLPALVGGTVAASGWACFVATAIVATVVTAAALATRKP